jgi:hypothetical protein
VGAVLDYFVLDPDSNLADDDGSGQEYGLINTPDGGWAVLVDPEGNEFCVLTAPADQAGMTG